MTSRPFTVKRALRYGLRHAPAPLQDTIGKSAHRVLDVLEPAPAPLVEPPLVGWTSPEPPLPPGLALGDLDATYRSWSVNSAPVGALDGYVDDSFLRFLHTWGLVADDTGACLEIGSNPYFTTFLLDRYSALELTLSNYYGETGSGVETVSFVPPGGGPRQEVQYRFETFNVEEDVFPLPDGGFDVVLFCETIEHLLMDPVAALCQIHRVLRPGGVLVLTTPNVARLGNVLAMGSGANIYDPYSGFGPYGRHNREYTMAELVRLLSFAGFEVERSFTADGHRWDPAAWACYPAVLPLVQDRPAELGQYLFVRARSSHPPRSGLPSFLYRSRPPGEIVDFE